MQLPLPYAITFSNFFSLFKQQNSYFFAFPHGQRTYDGFYAVITNLEGDVGEILKINRQRRKIEENFRIMKIEFEAHPVYVRRDDRIKAHFMTCYISLLIYRLLEKKIGDNYTSHQIIETLRSMQLDPHIY